MITFVVGHIVWSFGSPIAVIESCVPTRADRPWLERPGLIAMAIIYLSGAIFFSYQLVVAVGFHASAFQLIMVVLAIVAAVVAALLLPCRRRSTAERGDARSTGRSAPPPWLIGPVSLALLLGYVLVLDQWGWVGVALGSAALALLGLILIIFSRRPGWGQAHILAAAGGALLTYAIIAFWVNPEHVSRSELILGRGATLLGMLALLIFAAVRFHRAARVPEERAE
ncbi:hypothetical protein FOE78_01140 [Microlunatus elymi]|uniref:Uncharacterized protein n=1 Tax=Microlunatus elymi TaxID=2596828 RepID=A0A516PU77_9ACTN|nr:hypothetical protein [Microlunatus elymi]QDP94703.1 hypothetical protein FOE78_01140 [Microlunatus elymi]